MKLLSWFFPTDKAETGDLGETVGVLAAPPENLADELTALKNESDRRAEANTLALAEAKGREAALSDQLEIKEAAYRALLESIESKDATIAQLTKDIVDAKESADTLATQKLRSAGHDPIAIDSGCGSESLLEQYRKIPHGAEKKAFILKNRKALEAALESERNGTFA